MACPVYCLYNFTEIVDRSDHWHCCDDTKNDLTELGCSMTTLSVIQQAIEKRGRKNFRWIHSQRNTLPLRCLVACPKVQNSLEAMREEAKLIERPLLFNPEHCYSPMLPRMFSDPGDAVIGENEHGGRLISIRLDSEGRISPVLTRASREVIDDLSERYSAESGPPRAASVIDIESQPIDDSDADRGT